MQRVCLTERKFGDIIAICTFPYICASFPFFPVNKPCLTQFVQPMPLAVYPVPLNMNLGILIRMLQCYLTRAQEFPALTIFLIGKIPRFTLQMTQISCDKVIRFPHLNDLPLIRI